MKAPSSENEPIKLLRRQANVSAYSFPDNSPKWLHSLNKILGEDLGALAVLGPSGLTFRGVPSAEQRRPDPLSLSLASLVDSLRGTGRRIALGLPVGSRHLPLLFSAVSVLGDALRRAEGTVSSSLTGVLIISTDLDVRSRYCDLCVKTASLDSVYPGSRMKPNGEQVALTPKGSDSFAKGVCFLLPPSELPRTRMKPSLAILDFRYGRLTKRAYDIAQWACNLHRHTTTVALFTVGDRETLEALHKLNFETLPIDHFACGYCAKLKPQERGAGPVEWNIQRGINYLQRDHAVIAVEDTEFEALLASAQRMIDEQGQKDFASIRRAKWIVRALGQMPVPLIWYEQAARNQGRSTLKRLIDLLTVRHETGMGAALQSLRMQFEVILKYLEERNPRCAKLKEVLPTFAKEHGKVLILVRDKISQGALQNWLDVEAFPKAEWLLGTQVCACSDYSPLALTQFPAVLVNGSFPRRYRWIAGAALGDVVKFLAFASEVEVISSQLEDIYGAVGQQARAMQRNRVVGVPASTGSEVDAVGNVVPVLQLSKPSPAASPKSPAREFKVTATSLGDLTGSIEAAKAIAQKEREKAEQEKRNKLSTWEEQPDDEVTETAGGEFADLTSMLRPEYTDDPECLGFSVQSRLRGKGTVWLQADQTVECIRQSVSDEVNLIIASQIKVGDFLVFVQEDAKGSLFNRIVQLAEDQPELQYLAAYRKQWEEAMRLLAAKYDCSRRGYWRLFCDFQAHGSSISTEISVRNWVLGRVMGPDHVSSIRAAGSLVGMEALQRDASAFDKAFRTIRAIHQGLGRKLAGIIRKSSRHLVDEEEAKDDEVFGDHIWLPLNELLETVDLAEILGISDKLAGIPPFLVGRFLQRK